ncbi:MAG: alpha/beta hydrolase [Microthrixaceae bacterium]|nr:alpha/beta hydrolase [Microthrixaceae bacterium]MCO5313271.1 alpha/beta hydrolase [Microthrixaceae bacterium]
MTTVHTAQATSRRDVWFWSGPDRCHAWLYVPDREMPASGFATVVMAHGFAATKVMRLDAYAEAFCAAGYAVLVFDYRYFGDSEGEPRELLDIDAQLADWRAAVSFARSQFEVDPDRVALWGTSFAGGHVVATAAQDRRIAAVIAQCPFTDGVASARSSDRSGALTLMRKAIADARSAKRGGEPVRVAVAGRPGDLAMMTAADVADGYASIVPEGTTHRNMIPARIALKVTNYRPGRLARDTRCPLLMYVCMDDSVAPPGAAIKYAGQAPLGEVYRFGGGHFDIYTGDAFVETITAQLEFLQRVLPA